jgi:signal transduction histidine kinase
VFRIVQESLTNVTRYAQARQVQDSLQRQPDDDALLLQVRDDGCGFDTAEAARRNSFGLLGMQERAMALGGALDIESAPGQGTQVRVTIPLYYASHWQELA